MEIAQHPFFKKVDTAHLSGLLASSQVLDTADGELIFDEGAPSDALYLLLKGRVIFRKLLPTGHRLTVSLGEAGEYFGEIGLLTGEARSLRAESSGPAQIVRLPRADLLSYLEGMPGPVELLLESVIRHLHQTTRQYIDDMLHREKMAVVGSMMNTIIHDFKNPFCLISMSAQLLRQRHPDEPSVRLCKNIEGQVERMVTMAADLTEFSKGEYRVDSVPLDLAEVLREFQSLNQPYFKSENVSVQVSAPSLRIRGDKGKLHRVLQNLIMNAIEAIADKPNGTIEISAKADPENGVAILKIRDNGCGIPEEIRDRFFEPFVTHGKSGGTGLGSAIAKTIIDAHGGKIRFETVRREGTIFYITLPLAKG